MREKWKEAADGADGLPQNAFALFRNEFEL